MTQDKDEAKSIINRKAKAKTKTNRLVTDPTRRRRRQRQIHYNQIFGSAIAVCSCMSLDPFRYCVLAAAWSSTLATDCPRISAEALDEPPNGYCRCLPTGVFRCILPGTYSRNVYRTVYCLILF